MSRTAARNGFETFLDDTVDATRTEFSVQRALQGTGFGPGGLVIDRLRNNADVLERQLVEPELASYRRQALAQFDVVLSYVESDRPIEAFEDKLLEHDSYVEAIDPATAEDTRETIVGEIIERNRRLGDGIEPLVDRPEDDFWAATRAAFDESEAIDLVETAFPFTGPIRRHRDAFVFEARIDPGDVLGVLGSGLPAVSIEFTDEVIRATRVAERQIIADTKRKLRDRFDE